MVALLLIALVVGLLGMPNTRGRSLDDITRERYGVDHHELHGTRTVLRAERRAEMRGAKEKNNK